MSFFDLIRHLVRNGPFDSDADRESALAAIEEHEQQHHAVVAAVAQQHADPVAAAPVGAETSYTAGTTASYTVPAAGDFHPDPQ